MEVIKVSKLFDMSIFDPKIVWAHAVKAAANAIKNINAQAVGIYLQGYANSKREWDEQQIKRAPAPPAKLAKLTENAANYTMQVTYGSELVCQPKPNPWDIPAPAEPENQIIVGEELMPGIFAATKDGKNTTTPAGATTDHQGIRLTLIEQGKPGQLIYRKLWVAEGKGL